MRIAALLFASLASCPGDANWDRFNGLEDELSLELTSDAVGDAVTTDLNSTTGAVVVGTATIDPGSGPSGTRHVVLVDVDDEFEETVGRVSIFVDAGSRGREEFELVRDSADIGIWEVELESFGEEGETRTDTVSFRLWQLREGSSTADTDAQ